MVMEAQLFDGTILEFPDGTDPAVIQQTAKNVTARLNADGVQPQEQQQQTTSNPILGFGGRAADLFGNVLEAGNRLVEKPIAQLPEQYRPDLGIVNEMSQYAKDISKRINYSPSTKLGELGDNPLKVVPFIAERVITSSPDMMAAYAAAPAYIMGRTNEILNTRLKNDSKEYKDATITDLSASVAAAVLETYLEKFATKGLLTGKGPLGGSVAKRIGKETAIQTGTEAAEEGIGYLGGAAGTQKGIDPAEMAQNMIEGAIVGGGLGASVQGGKEYFNRPGASTPQVPPASAPIPPEVDPNAPIAPAGVSPQSPMTGVPTGSQAQDYEAMMADLEGRPITPTVTAPTPTVTPPTFTPTTPEIKPTEGGLADATTVPPTEINEQALTQNNFVFPEKGGIKSVYGNIVEQDGKKYIEYRNEAGDKRKRLLTEKVMVNPSPDDLELMDLYKERDKLATQGDRFLRFLKDYKINPAEKTDMGIESNDKRIPVGVFSKTRGKSLDDLALIALEDGVLTETDLQDGVGGVESLRELIRQTLTGEGAKTMVNADRDFALQRIQDEIDAREANAVAQEESVAGQLEQEAADIEDATTLPLNYSQATVEQKAAAEKGAQIYRDNGLDAKIIYQDGDIALAQTRRKNGDIVYTPIQKGTVFSSVHDIGSILGGKQMDAMKLTQAQKDALLKAKDAIETPEIEKHAKNPFLVIKPGVTGSAGVPKDMVNVARGWAKMLGIKGDIYITTKAEASANKDKFTGPHRPIGYMGDKVQFGSVRELDDGSYAMVINPGASKVRVMETIAHELGHIHEKQVFNNADVKTKNAIIKEFNAWFSTHQNISAKELVESMRPKVTAQQTQFADPMAKASTADPYWRSFSEWYADQVSRWSTSTEKPLTVVDKFFKRLADALKKFYSTVKGGKFLPTQTMKDFLDGIANQSIINEIADRNNKGQMALFSKQIMESEPKDISESQQTMGAPSRRNYAGAQAPLSNWNMPDNTKMENFLYRIQDKYIDTKRMIKAINDQVGEISDKWDTYLKEELYHGRTAKRTNDFLKDDLLPIVKQMQKDNISVEQFDDYLHNRHAEERNIQVAKINPDMPDSGSGISTADADAYLNSLDPKRRAQLEGLAKKVDSIIKDTQKILVDSGLENQETIDAWNKTYKKYVPLMREDLDFSNKATGLGSGFSVKGGSTKRAVGSLKNVADIFANVAGQRERAIVRSEKARVGTSLYGLAIQNPNPGFWLPVNPDAIKDPAAMKRELVAMGVDPADADNLMQEPKQQYIDPVTGLVAYRVNPILRNSDNVFPVRINGKDRFIFFNPNNERSMRMAESIKNLDAEQLGWALGNAAKVTRWLASVNTQYNPVFGAYNFIRDVGGAQFNLSTTPIAGEQAAVTAGVFPALKGIYKDLRASRAGKPIDGGEWSKLFEEYQREGGATGYRDQFSRNRDESSVIEREMANLNKGNVKKAVNSVFNWLSDYNDAMENAVRLSAYKVALDKGITKERAASIAKNLTVNFNRKGERAQQLGALYAFFNASVQGSARLAETLKGPAGKKIIGGGLLLGSVQALALAMAGFEDDDIPEFVKERNLVIPLPGKNYLAIPMPLGLHVIPNMGRIPTEMVLTGGKNASKKVGNMLGVILNTFNPIGSAGLSTQTIAPTLVDPIVGIFENRDNFGRPIAKEDRATNPTPGYTRSRDTASELSKGLSYFLNYVTSGGSKYQKGWMSPTPDQLDFLFGQATGGVGREIMKTEQAITSLLTGEELPSYKVPLVGKFYGDTQSQAAQSNRFYENVTAMANHENEIKGRQKNRESVTDYYNDHPEARLYSQANTIENEITKLNKQKKEMIARNAPKEQIKRLEERKTLIMQRFNERVRKLENQ